MSTSMSISNPVIVDFDDCKDVLLSSFSSNFTPEHLPGLESQCQTLYNLLETTLQSQQNNAAMLLGPSKSGKRSCINHTIRQLRRKYNPQGISFKRIELNGLLHLNDTLAIREIAHQLSVDMDIELCDNLNNHNNGQHANTVNHFNYYLSYILQLLKSDTYTRTPIFIVLYNFHFFTQHNKQTLLYNLCDVLQTCSVQCCLIGISTQLNVYDLLEKRIRSRMFYRRILCFNSLPSQQSLLSLLESRLLIDETKLIWFRYLSIYKRSQAPVMMQYEQDNQVYQNIKMNKCVNDFNRSMTSLLASKTLMSKCWYYLSIGHSISWLMTCFQLALCQADPPMQHQQKSHPLSEQSTKKRKVMSVTATHDKSNPIVSDNFVVSILDDMNQHPQYLLLSSCSDNEMILVLAMISLHKREVQPYNFQMMYDEYLEILKLRGNASNQIIDQKTSLIAFEHLSHKTLIRFEQQHKLTQNNIDTYSLRQFKMCKFQLDPSIVIDLIKHKQIKSNTWIQNCFANF